MSRQVIQQVPLCALPPNTPSIYISFVHPATRESYLARSIARLWGHPSSVQIIPRRLAVSGRGRARAAEAEQSAEQSAGEVQLEDGEVQESEAAEQAAEQAAGEAEGEAAAVGRKRRRTQMVTFTGGLGPSRAIVHMAAWHNTAAAQDARASLLRGEYVKLDAGRGHFYGCTLYKFR